MKYMILDRNNGWFKPFEGSEDDAIKETERMSHFHGCRFGLYDDKGKLIGWTYIPEPTYVFLRG